MQPFRDGTRYRIDTQSIVCLGACSRGAFLGKSSGTLGSSPVFALVGQVERWKERVTVKDPTQNFHIP
jgi:hypothetical protein